jgi:hypothetical protein
MSWHHPDQYFFLCLAGSLAAFLAPSIIDELTSTIGELFGSGRKPPVVEPRRSTVNEKAVDPPLPPKHPSSPRPKYLKKAPDRSTGSSVIVRDQPKRASKRPSNSVGFARVSRTSRRRSKQAACVTISEFSEDRAPRRAEIERASYAGSHPARFNGSNSARIRAFKSRPADSRRGAGRPAISPVTNARSAARQLGTIVTAQEQVATRLHSSVCFASARSVARIVAARRSSAFFKSASSQMMVFK